MMLFSRQTSARVLAAAVSLLLAPGCGSATPTNGPAADAATPLDSGSLDSSSANDASTVPPDAAGEAAAADAAETSVGRDSGVATADAAAPDSGGATDGGPINSGVQVLFPPPLGNPAYAAVQTYLMESSSPAFPHVGGVVIEVNWSDIDLGSAGAHTGYDFTIPDAAAAAWMSAGKTVHFVLQNTTYGGTNCPATGPGSHGTSGIGNCAMPAWVWTALTSANYTTCGTGTSAQQVPNFRAPTFVTAYQGAIAALLQHYASNPSVGYVRIGLGKGGEINLPSGWTDTTTGCGQMYTTTWGYTLGTSSSATWNAYLESMVQYEGSLGSHTQLMVSITPVTGPGATGTTIPDFLAPVAVAHGIGFGNQGLQYSDTTQYPNCGGDWCKLFATYTGQVPLELQTLGQSCPAGVGQCPNSQLSNLTGALTPLLPFAVAHHATILELYYQDWLVAYDPTNADNASYGAAYKQAIETASGAL